MVRLTFHLDTPLERTAALDRGDGIIDVLRELGIKLVATDNGTGVFLTDEAAFRLSALKIR